jgi:hypothetical protein
MSIGCPSCAQMSPLQHKEGQRVTMSTSGYGITYSDFVGLLNQEGWREQAHPLIAQHLACSIEQRGKGFVLKAKSGALIPYEAAHLQMQAHSSSQYQLYQLVS